ncbi:MAG: tRNA pseudouridine(13) synthase TruD [Phycisphaerae bacterium]|nr:tRNA pseudouridine(13) synthase TruD [Phycisphaerae bacterium]
MHQKHQMTLVGNNQAKQIHGVLKSTPEDFVVDELPLYEPCGVGEHLYLQVTKTNMSHEYLIRNIAKRFGVKKRDIGCAGRKDLKAVTTQMLSLYLPGKSVDVPNAIDGIKVRSFSWHSNKLRLGHLLGNRFSICLREVDSSNFTLIEQRLKSLSETGLPNYFGPQRFGNNNDNHLHGQYFITQEWQQLVDSMLSGKERHHKFAKNGEYKKALDAWQFGQPAQRNILEALIKDKSPEQACKTIPRTLVTLCVNAFQSAIFNEVLQQRVKTGSYNKFIEGDLVWNHEGGGRTFCISSEEVVSADILERSAQCKVSPSGPLWGAKMRLPSEEVLCNEKKVVETFGVTEEHLNAMKKFAQGARRPLCVPVKNTSVKADSDSILLQFDLPAGSYATVVINILLNGVL